MKKSILILATAFTLSAFFTSCRDTAKESEDTEMSDDMNDVGDDLEEAADDTGDAIENAANETGEAVDNAANEVGEELDGDDN
tara:strand:- start:1319 stop:1567 length:249 start_codon:yes stop_codon:yes gene_type:complete